MKTKALKLVVAIGILTTITACNSVIVTPKTNNTTTAFANSDTEKQALKLVITKAKSICYLQGKNLKILDLNTTYQGNTKSQQQVVQKAKTIFPPSKTFKTNIPAAYRYRANISFKCE